MDKAKGWIGTISTIIGIITLLLITPLNRRISKIETNIEKINTKLDEHNKSQSDFYLSFMKDIEAFKQNAIERIARIEEYIAYYKEKFTK